MSWNIVNLEEKISQYLDVMDENFILEIKNLYEKLYEKSFGQYSLLDKKELKEDLFNNSVFMKVFKEDPNYAFEKSEDYWAKHIIKEISNNLNLEALEAFEKNRIMEEVKTIPLSIVATLDHLTKSTRFYLNKNFVTNLFYAKEKEISISISNPNPLNASTATSTVRVGDSWMHSLEELDIDVNSIRGKQLVTTSLCV